MTATPVSAPVVCLRSRRRHLARRRADPVRGRRRSPRSATPGLRVGFLSNNSSMPVGDVVAKLERLGVPAEPDDVLTSAVAAGALARLARSRARACSCARGPGCVEALDRRRARRWSTSGPADAVVVGFHRDFDFDELDRASRAVREGARFVATNLDATYPTPGGLIPGAGALVAAVATASAATPEVAGKPEPPTVALVRQRLGDHRRDGGRPAVDRRRAGRRARLAVRARAVGRHRGGRAAGRRGDPDRRRRRSSPPTSARSRPLARRCPDLTRTARRILLRLVTVRRRLDAELRAPRPDSRAPDEAADAIAAGRVLVGGQPRARRRPGWSTPSEPIHVTGDRAPLRVAWGREARGRARALRRRSRAGRRALDAGASTGGFTDCLLQAGAGAGRRGRRRAGPAGVGAARTIPGSPCCERTNVRSLEPERHRRPGRPRRSPTSRSSRCVTVAPALARCTHRRRRARAAREAAVRGRARAGRQGRGRARPRRAPGRARARSRDGLARAGLVVVDVDGVAAAAAPTATSSSCSTAARTACRRRRRARRRRVDDAVAHPGARR